MHRRIVILLFGDLGDTLLTVPAIRALRTRFPDSRLTLLAKELPGQIVDALDLVDEVVVVDKHLFDRPASILSPTAWLRLLRVFLRLRAARADTVVLFHHLVTRWGTVKFGLLALASGATERVGIDNGRGWFLTRSVTDQGFGARHEAEYYLDVARLLGAEGALQLEAPVTPDDRLAAERILARAGLVERRIMAVHPGSGWYGPGRRWPAPAFARAVELVLREEDLTCVLIGTDQEAHETGEVAAYLGSRAVDLTGRTTVGQLGAVLKRCEVVLANDGGVAHLAAAVGTPAVTIFGPSNDRAWRPLLGTVVASDLPCRPCFYVDFRRGLPAGCATRECMSLVTPRMVADAALSLLRERRVAV